jgi:UDP-N-acetylmuramoyl-tripeptide--D-alanyl-D-alanine ligase
MPLETLKSISAPRKRFVLGHISDYQGNNVPRYRDTFQAAKAIVDEVIFVGPNGKMARATEADIAEGRFKSFPTIASLAEYIKATAIPEEVILLKSSQGMHLERVFLNTLDEVRCWPDDCGVRLTCKNCGHFAMPFSEHPAKRSTDVDCYRLSAGELLQ